MTRKEKLYERAKRARANFSFNDACALAESVGFEFERQAGSHRIYSHPKAGMILNLQDVGGKVKPYQLRQLLDAIDDFGLLEGEP